MIRYDRPDSRSLQFGEIVEENIDDASNKIRQLTEAFNERFTLKNPRFAERYIKGRCDVHVHIRFSQLGLDPVDFCAVFHPQTLASRDLDFNGRRSVNHGGWAKPHCYEKPVLVYDVESVKGKKRIVPSLVRLQFLDQAHRSIAGSVYFSPKLGFKVLSAFPDKELGLIIGSASIGVNELPRQMIQGRTQIVDNIASDGGESQRNCVLDPNVNDPIAGLSINLGNRRIRLTFEKGLDFRFEITDVLFGPVDLGFDARSSSRPGQVLNSRNNGEDRAHSKNHRAKAKGSD